MFESELKQECEEKKEAVKKLEEIAPQKVLSLSFSFRFSFLILLY
jgi:hypothetical protein